MDFLGGAAAKLQREQKKRAEEAQRKQQKERAARERAAAKAAAHEARAEQVMMMDGRAASAPNHPNASTAVGSVVTNSMLPPGSTRVSGRASALLGVAGLSLATHRPLLCGDPTYYTALTGQVLRTTRRHCLAARCC